MTAAIAATVAFTSCGNVSNMYSEANKRLDEICNSLFPCGEPGAAVLILKGDDVIYEGCYGIADIETKTPIDGDSFFNIASVSKQFTATAVMQLAERGLLSLDDCVAEYHPEYKAEFWKTITLRHLLSHSSGVPDGRGYLTREAKIHGDEALAMEFLPELDHLNFEPGSNYEYINPTFVLLGDIVEKVSGMAFTDYVRKNIFVPAGMEKTLYFTPDAEIPNMTHGYEYADVEDMPEERTAGDAPEVKNWYEYDYGEETFFATRPDGGIYTSVHEFVKWEKAIRACSVLGSFEEAHTPHVKVSGSPFSDYQNRPGTWYGYGWFIEPDKGCIYHTGDNGGYKILAARYPGSDALVLVFSNRADWDRNELKIQIEELYRF